MVITAKFPIKQAKGNKEPISFHNGRFDGLDLCPLNPAVGQDKSPLYLLAWQNAEAMTEDEENGTVYFYDLASGNVDRSKFMIQCPRGNEIQTLLSPEGHAVLIWS